MAFLDAGIPVRSGRSLTKKAFDASLKMTDQWLHDGIFVLTHEDLNTPAGRMHELPSVLFARGDRLTLQLPAAAIVNSRKPRRIAPDDKWLTETISLVRLAIAEGFAIVSSYGNIPYSTVSRLSRGRPLIVVCDDLLPFMAPKKAALEFLSAYQDLFDLEHTVFISPFPPGRRLASDARSRQRDHLVAALASALFVAEVRKGGNMQQIIDIAAERKGVIVQYSPCSQLRSSFDDCDPVGIRPPDAVAIRSRAPKQERVQFVCLQDSAADLQWLIHYTRSWPGPWPGQTIAEYCQSLIDGAKGACHTALDTLVRILDERLIRASNRLTRGHSTIVSFSECLPHELASLIKWRKGLCRWSFEPYGIAFPRKSLLEVHVEPALYGSKENFQRLPENLKHLFQAQGSASDDWTAEREWRVQGDIPLSDAIFREMVVIVPSVKEATAVALEFGCKVALAGIDWENGVRRS